jgi:glucoamylase
VTGEVDLRASDGLVVLALAFGPTAMEAGQHAVITLMEDFDVTKAEYVRGWKAWHASLDSGRSPKTPHRALYYPSAAVLRTHEEKRVEGGVIATYPFHGASRGDDDMGEHLIWPQDLVETATAFVAIGARHEARRVLQYYESRRATATGRRTCGWTARHTGTAFRWTKRPPIPSGGSGGPRKRARRE